MKNQVGTVGRFLPGIRYQLNPVPGIEDGGVLSIAGPNIMKGYLFADQPGVLVAPKEGWYDTGDVVSIDPAGYITIKGRVKRFAKIAGEMVSLVMVESKYDQLWPAYQHAVISITDPKKGEQLMLFTTNPEATRGSGDLCESHWYGDIAIPKKIVILKVMPQLSTGKIDYTRCSRNYPETI